MSREIEARESVSMLFSVIAGAGLVGVTYVVRAELAAVLVGWAVVLVAVLSYQRSESADWRGLRRLWQIIGGLVLLTALVRLIQ